MSITLLRLAMGLSPAPGPMQLRRSDDAPFQPAVLGVEYTGVGRGIASSAVTRFPRRRFGPVKELSFAFLVAPFAPWPAPRAAVLAAFFGFVLAVFRPLFGHGLQVER